MVEVDVFWAYGLGGTLAAAAGKQLKQEKEPMVTHYFVKALMFLALIWAPTGLLLLLKHPSWETMQAASSFGDMPAWLTLGFGITNVTQGILGFLVTTYLMKKGKIVAAHLNWMVGYFGMFFILLYGWDGLGYDRFLYDRDMFGGVPWTAGVGLEAGFSFLISSVAMTLYFDGLFLIPPLVYMWAKWNREGAMNDSAIGPERTPSPVGLTFRYFLAVFVIGLGTAAFSAVFVNYTGQLLGVGSHVARSLGQIPANTSMHILSYFIGLPLSIGIVYFALLRKGMPIYNFFLKMDGTPLPLKGKVTGQHQAA